MHKLLVVDDEVAILFAMREFFSAAGYEVDCAECLAEAVARLEDSDYEAIIADLRLSGSGGTEGLEIVDRARALRANARVVILTAYGSPEVEREARRRGADAFVLKPTPLPGLALIIAELDRPAADEATVEGPIHVHS